MMPPSFLSRFQNFVFGFYLVGIATSMSLMEIGSVALLVVILLRVLRKEITVEWKAIPFLKPILLFIVVEVVSVLLSDAVFKDQRYDIARMRFFLVYVLLYLQLRYFTKKGGWMALLGGVCAAVGVYGFIQHFMPLDLIRPEGKKVYLYAIQDDKIGPLVVGLFNHHLTFANAYGLLACLFGGLAISRIAKAPLYGALAGLLFLDVLWSGSRAAWMAIPVCILILAWLKRPRYALVGAVGIALFLGFSYTMDKGFQERARRTLFAQDALYGGDQRMKLWRAQWEMFKDHPLLGIGYNNNERHAKDYLDKLYPNDKDPFYGHAHSTPLQILACMGILGVIAFVWLWVAIFLKNVRALQDLPWGSLDWGIAAGLLAGLIGFQIQGLTQWNFGDAEVLHGLMFAWALLATLPERNRR